MSPDVEAMTLIIVCALVALALHVGFDVPWPWALVPIYLIGIAFLLAIAGMFAWAFSLQKTLGG